MKNAGLKTKEEAMHRMIDGEVFEHEGYELLADPAEHPQEQFRCVSKADNPYVCGFD